LWDGQGVRNKINSPPLVGGARGGEIKGTVLFLRLATVGEA